jgi:anti-sigma B factor antagonist
MDMQIEEKNDITIIHLRGKLFGGSFTDELSSVLHKLLDEGKKNFILGLDGVTILNSSGFGIIVGTFTTIRNGGGQLKLAGISSHINELFSITKLNKIFQQYDSIEDAVKSFEQPDQK